MAESLHGMTSAEMKADEEKSDSETSSWDGLLQGLNIPESESNNTPRKHRTNSPLSDETHDTISHHDIFELNDHHSDEAGASTSDKSSEDLRASHSSASESSLSHESTHVDSCEQFQEGGRSCHQQSKDAAGIHAGCLDSPSAARNGTLRRCCSPLTSHLHGGNCNSFRESEYGSDESSVASFLSEDSTVSVPNYYHCHEAHTWTNSSMPISECFVEGHEEVKLEQIHCNSIKDCSRILPQNETAKVGNPLHFEPVPCLMSLEDYPALSTTSLILQERDRRFVRRCAPCRNYSLWRQKAASARVSSLSLSIKRGLEKMILLTPMAVSIALLIYCFALEDPDLTDRELVSIPLLNAAEGGDVNQVALLLDNGAFIEQRNYYGLTALHRASEEGKIHVVRLLLSRGADYNAQDCDGGRPLEKAAQQGHRRTVNMLAAWGADVHYKDTMGYTLLMRAAEWGWLDVVMSILHDGKTDINELDLFGETALLKAARQSRREVVDALIRHRANVGHRCADGNTILVWAVRNGWLDLLPLLLSYEGVFSPRDKSAALSAAVKRGMLAEASLLIKRGADPKKRDPNGNTLLMRAASLGHYNVVKALLKVKCCPVDARNVHGKTALMLAAERDDKEGYRCAALLVSWRASINLVDDSGETPLIKAASNGNLHLVKHLLSKGARTDLVDSAGFSALRRATFEGHEDVVKILIGGNDARLAQPSVKQIISQLGLVDLPDLVASLKDGLAVHSSLSSSSVQHRSTYNLAGRVWSRMLTSWGVGGLVLHPPARRVQMPAGNMASGGGRGQLDGDFFRRSGESRMREVKEQAEAAETCRHLPRLGIDSCKPRVPTRDLDLKAALEDDARVPCDSLCMLERLAPWLSAIWRRFTKRKRLMSCRTRDRLLLHIMRFGERLRQIEYENASIVVSPQTLYGEEAADEEEYDDCGGDCDGISEDDVYAFLD